MAITEIKPEISLKKYYLASFWISFILIITSVTVPIKFAPFPLSAILFWTAIAVIIAGVGFLIWIPAFFRELEYAIEEDIVRGKKGVFFKKRVTVPFTKITNIDITQGPMQRFFNIGSIHVQTAGATGPSGHNPELRIDGIADCDKLKDEIMTRVKGFLLKHNSSTIQTSAPAENIPGENPTLVKILDELTAIRKALEKSNG